MSKPIRVVTFWVGEEYRVMAEEMAASADRVGLKTKIYAGSSLGSWKKNTEQKSKFLRMAMADFNGEDILWVDADSQFVQSPKELLTLPDCYEMAIYTEDVNAWGCTLFLRNSYSSRILLDRWDRQINKTPQFSADSNLLYVLKKFPSTSVYHLPPSYVWHHQHMRQRFPTARPVIAQRMFVTFENRALRRSQVVNRGPEDWK